jgi:acetate kinase
MGGIDILAFAGGVGENAWYIREKVCSGLEFMGILLDKEKNRNLRGEGIVSLPDSPVLAVVVRADEEEMIARDTYDIAAI